MLTQMTTLMCPQGKYNIKSPSTMTPAGICVHETAGKASAMAEISYMVTNNNYVSYHYAVDDYRSVQGLPEDRISWNCGATWGNYHLIAVEICYSGIGGELYEKSVSNAAYLVAMLLHKYKWGLEKVTTHNAQNGKDCPHIQLSRGFNNFIKMVSNAYDDLFGNKQPTPVTSPTPVATKPTARYVVGRDYKVQVNNLNIRTGPGTNCRKKAKGELTASGQRQSNAKGQYNTGTIVTCQEISNVGNDVWIRTPSGWLCGYYQGTSYIG